MSYWLCVNSNYSDINVSRTDGRGCRKAGEESPGFAGQDAG